MPYRKRTLSHRVPCKKCISTQSAPCNRKCTLSQCALQKVYTLTVCPTESVHSHRKCVCPTESVNSHSVPYRKHTVSQCALQKAYTLTECPVRSVYPHRVHPAITSVHSHSVPYRKRTLSHRVPCKKCISTQSAPCNIKCTVSVCPTGSVHSHTNVPCTRNVHYLTAHPTKSMHSHIVPLAWRCSHSSRQEGYFCSMPGRGYGGRSWMSLGRRLPCVGQDCEVWAVSC